MDFPASAYTAEVLLFRYANPIFQPSVAPLASCKVFHKDTRMMLSRKELSKDMLKMSVHTWKRIVEPRLTEEEVNLLRLYINQPGYVDLHWILAFIRQKLVYRELQEKNL